MDLLSFPSSESPYLPPRVNHLINSVTLEHSSKICRQAYPPGKHFTVPQWPDVDEVNRRGDFALEYSRLAYIDGDRDPWRYCVSFTFS